jgi:plastocyanin
MLSGCSPLSKALRKQPRSNSRFTNDEAPMNFKRSLVSATLVLVAVLALIAAGRSLSQRSTRQPANSGSASPTAVTVVIRRFRFEPATVTVHAGETVEWKNDGIVPHTATADGKTPAFDSGSIDPGSTWRYVARKKGTYNYTCTYHPNMKGKLIVQ